MKIPKSYRYYKLAHLKQIFQVQQEEVLDLLHPVADSPPSTLLLEILKRNLRIPMQNEKAKSELLVMPIFVEMWEKNPAFKPLSGITFSVEPPKGLTGRCDFLISINPYAVELDNPIVAVFEAKDDRLEKWYGQCGSEMLATHIYNERNGNPMPYIYGAITNGFTWQFLKLENNVLYIDAQRYGTANLPQLLGAIQKVYDFYK